MSFPRRFGLSVLLAVGVLATPAAAAALPFTPQLTATLGSADQPSHVGGHPPFTTVVTQPDNQARIRKAVVTLPAGLFANVNALGTLCNADQANVFACPTASQVGSAKAASPWLQTPLTGGVFIEENPTGGLPGLFIGLGATGPVSAPLQATTALNGNRLVTTLDNLPNAPVSSFELTINGGPNGLFTVGNPLCDNPTVESTFTSFDGQTVTNSSPLNIVGTCVAVPPPAAAATPATPATPTAPAPPATPTAQAPSTARPTLALKVRGVASKPALTLQARSAPGAAKLRSVRLALPASQLAFVRAALGRGITTTQGTKWSLSGAGALTLQAPAGGSSAITATIRSGAVRSSTALRKLAAAHKTLPRLKFVGRVTDVKNTAFSYRLSVRPLA